MVQPCEAAYLAAVDASRVGGSLKAPPVTVLVLYVISFIRYRVTCSC